MTNAIRGGEALPAGWRTARLGEVAEQCLGKMLDAAKNKGRPLPYLRNPNVRWFNVDTADLREMPFEERELDRYGLAEGDVLICEGGAAGRAAIWDGRCTGMKFQKALHRVRTGPDLLNRFLVHHLKVDYDSGRLSSYYTGATIKHLTGQDLLRYEILLPPLCEQRRIVDVLDRAEALRTLRRAVLAQLDTFTQSIFFEMFGDPTNLDQWPVRSIADYVADFQGGKSFQPEDPGASTERRVLKISAVTSGRFIPLESKPVRDDHHPEPEHFVRPGDLLISRANTAELVGAVALVDTCPPNLLLPDKLWRFVWRHPISIDPLFARSLFQNASFRRQMSQAASGTGGSMKNISKAKLRGMTTIVPPLDLQRQFADRVRTIECAAGKQRASLTQLDALCASIQHRAFRGEL